MGAGLHPANVEAPFSSYHQPLARTPSNLLSRTPTEESEASTSGRRTTCASSSLTAPERPYTAIRSVADEPPLVRGVAQSAILRKRNILDLDEDIQRATGVWGLLASVLNAASTVRSSPPICAFSLRCTCRAVFPSLSQTQVFPSLSQTQSTFRR